jgi:hemerythrin-like domain-containing protein
MYATDLLENEHRVIEQVLDCLDQMAYRYIQGEPLDLFATRQAIDFLHNFADQCHHVKEEKHLFPVMEARGSAREHGPISRMLAEHARGREYLHALAEAAEGAATGEAESRYEFADHARAYIFWLREHITTEDERLFPMANRSLTEEDQRRLLRSFESVEEGEMRAGMHAKYLHIANELADHFGVPRAHPEHACTACGHGGPC